MTPRGLALLVLAPAWAHATSALTQDGWNYNLLTDPALAVSVNQRTANPVAELGFDEFQSCSPRDDLPSIASGYYFPCTHPDPLGNPTNGSICPVGEFPFRNYYSTDTSGQTLGIEGRMRSDIRMFATWPTKYKLQFAAYILGKTWKEYKTNTGKHAIYPYWLESADEDLYGQARALAQLAVTGKNAYAQFSNATPYANGGIWYWGFPTELDLVDQVRAWLQWEGACLSPAEACEKQVWWASTRALDIAYATAESNLELSGTRAGVTDPQTLQHGFDGKFYAVSGEDDAALRPTNVGHMAFPQYSMNVLVTDPNNYTNQPIAVGTRFSIAHAWTRVQNSASFSNGARIKDYVPSIPINYSFPYQSVSSGASNHACLNGMYGQTFPVVAGTTYTISTVNGSSWGDTWLTVLGACNCANDDYGGTLQSQCSCTAEYTGDAYLCASTYSSYNSAGWLYKVTASEAQPPMPSDVWCAAFTPAPAVYALPQIIPCPNTNQNNAAPGQALAYQVFQLGPTPIPPNPYPDLKAAPNPGWSTNVASGYAYTPRRRTVPRPPSPILESDAEVIVFLNGQDSSLEEAAGFIKELHLLALSAENRALPHPPNYTVIAVDLPGAGYADKPNPNTTYSPFWNNGTESAEGHGSSCTWGNGCSDFDANQRHDAPLLKFQDNFVVDFLAQLNDQIPADKNGKKLKDKLVAVFGGSLGGNLALRLGRTRGDGSFPYNWQSRAAGILPPNVIAFSPMSSAHSSADGSILPCATCNPSAYLVPDAVFGATNGMNHMAVLSTMTKAGLVGPGQVDGNSPETPASRANFFREVYDCPATGCGGVGSPQSEYWFSQGFPCRRSFLTYGRIMKQEYYDGAVSRIYHWRMSADQLLYSHQAAASDESPTWPPSYDWTGYRYAYPAIVPQPYIPLPGLNNDPPVALNIRKNFRNTLLLVGLDDTGALLAGESIWSGLWTPHGDPSVPPGGVSMVTETKRLANYMNSTPGRFVGVMNTGHSLPDERPHWTALEVEAFLGMKQWDPVFPAASPCLGRQLDGRQARPIVEKHSLYYGSGAGYTMVGCDGPSSFGYNFPGACNVGWHVCGAQEWVNKRQADYAVPQRHYWADDVLTWNGVQGACMASLPTDPSNWCSISNQPMRISAPSQVDAVGNLNILYNCGYRNTTPQYFGGCSNSFGSALCCRNGF